MKTLERLYYITLAALLLWVAFSFFDIVIDNITAAPQHSPLNFFVILTNGGF